MTAHLIAISIGPVQEFIASARRTRDLWFGSFLLSEVCKATSRAIADAKGELIFPAPEDPSDLEEESPLNVANVILAELPPNVRPEIIRDLAKKAAEISWKKFATEAKEKVEDRIRHDLWEDQLNDVIEFYAAWTPVESKEAYPQARQKLMRLLAGRKALKDFGPAKGRPLIPKSSLDGRRESVWNDRAKTDALNKQLELRLRLAEGEQLDVVALTKRLAGGKKGYPSVSRIAADPWLRGLAKSDAKDELAVLISMCEPLVAKGLGRVKWTRFSDFQYEGSIVYRNRHKEFVKEIAQDFSILNKLVDVLKNLEKNYGEPAPYMTVLVADGDRMGKSIAAIESAVEHRKFSQQLATFTEGAEKTVEEHKGALVYSGGDDVLAFLPLDQSLACARALHDQFAHLMAEWTDLEGRSPTLSVGLAIGHFMVPLEDLLEYGRNAEHAAKGTDRNGLAVHLHVRGGAPIKIQGQWTAGLDERLENWTRLHQENKIPDKAAYDLRELAQNYKNWPHQTAGQQVLLASALQSDVLRLIKKKKGGQGEEGLNELEMLLKTVCAYEDILQVANEIILARQLAKANLQAKGISQNRDKREQKI